MPKKKKLIQAAWEARSAAYAPYSGYAVGAAIGAEDGTIITGCNVENASYGLTCCAERVAVFKAVSQNITSWNMLVIAADDPSLPYPCGACRQVLWEFSQDLTIVSVNRQEQRHISLRQLLPDAFELKGVDDGREGVVPSDLRKRLFAAGRSGHETDVLQILQQHPKLARVIDPLSGLSPLHQAARHGHLTLIKTLVKKGADVNAANRWGLTPLHYALRAQQPAAAELLRSYGAKSTSNRR